MRYALFCVAGAHYAVPLEKVLCMRPLPEIYPLPKLNPLFSGVFVHQGGLVPLVAETFFGGSKTGQAQSTLIVCEAEYGPVAFAAEQIDRITAPDEISGADKFIDPGSADVISSSGMSWKLLDLNQLLEAPGGVPLDTSG